MRSKRGQKRTQTRVRTTRDASPRRDDDDDDDYDDDDDDARADTAMDDMGRSMMGDGEIGGGRG